MKVTIDIPQKFERHFNKDKFEDSLKRLKADAGTFCMAGKYEIELCEMLIEAFKNAISKESAHWENEHYNSFLKCYTARCSECTEIATSPFENINLCFCPNCGAEIKEGE